MNKKCLWCNGTIGNERRCLHCGRSDDFEYESKVKAKQDQHNILEPEHGPLWKGKGHEAGYQRKKRVHKGANRRRIKSGSKAKAK